MGLNYKSLCKNVRGHKLSELILDVHSNSLYHSPRLNQNGLNKWHELLKLAAEKHDDDWLASQLVSLNLMNPTITDKNGRISKMPSNAPSTLAEGEFNRLYCRGVCLEAIANNETEVEVYRGKTVQSPRSESTQLIGTKVCPRKLLADLRSHTGVDTALGLPGGPNSGLTIKRIKD